MKFNRERAEDFLWRVVDEKDAVCDGVLLNNLLREFHRGFPLENLRLLLASSSQSIVTAGAWIASELGAKGRPLLPDIVPLLTNPARKVRFFAIDCVLVWAGPEDKEALATAAALVDDSDAGVRWKAMDFLARATREQIRGALAWSEHENAGSEQAQGLRLLLSRESQDAKSLEFLLDSSDATTRKYAAIAAVRLAELDRRPLVHASTLEDADIRDFAETAISLL